MARREGRRLWGIYRPVDNTRPLIEGPRTRVGQLKMKYWNLHELHRNEVKKKKASHMSICPKSSILSSS